jgi:uncharacterized membrane protein YccC
VLDGLEVDDALRVVSYLVLALGSNAVIAAGGRVDAALRLPTGTPRESGVTEIVIRIARTVRIHLTPASSVLHDSLRVALGLALAVLLARLLQLEHAFWVVLGTLSVLRSNTLATERTTLLALVGAVAGFILGAIFVVVVSETSAVALPVTVFLAAYAPSAIGFVVGQAAFTLYIIILFNLISPAGWRIGLARIEDVAVGAGNSVVVGLILWPRGARVAFRHALAELYHTLAVFLIVSFDAVLAGATAAAASQARNIAVHARDRAAEAFDQLVRERGARHLDPQTAAMLVASGTHAIMVGDLLTVIEEKGAQAQGCSTGFAVLQAQQQAMVATFLRLADRLRRAISASGPQERVSGPILREAALTCLRRWQEDPARGQAALAVVRAGEWIQFLDALAADLEEPVTAVVEATQEAWWR